MSARKRICLVEDDASVRESLEALLVTEGFQVDAYGSAAEMLERFEPEVTACVLLDVRLPGMDGLTLLETLEGRRQDVPAVVMTGHADLPMAVRAIRAGAADFVEKPFEADRLLDSIRHAISKARNQRATSAAPELEARFSDLTPRETEVMQQMVIGLPNKLIADALDMSPRTVEIHRSRVMQKTRAKSLSHLVRMAIRAGFDPDAGGDTEET
jgi:two-component system response regulator FixJ